MPGTHAGLRRLFPNARTLVCVAAALTFVVGCGGGGGGGTTTTPPPPASPTLEVSTNSVSVNALISDANAPTAAVGLTLLNPPAETLYVGVGGSETGIASISLASGSAGQATLNITFKLPYQLAPGTYRDSLTVELCTDDQCNTVASITPQTITVTYVVAAPSGGSAPHLVVATTSVQANATTADTSAPATQNVSVSVSNLTTAPGFTVNVTQTHNAISTVNVSNLGNATASIGIAFTPPAQLPAGTYADTVTLTACYDAACVNPIPGSPVTINVAYAISATVGGAAGYTVTTYPFTANDIATDPVRPLIYLSLPSSVGANGNSVIAVDPTTGIQSGSAFAGSEPSTLAVSDDGQLLYVELTGTNAIQRFALPALTADIKIQLGHDTLFGSLYAGDLKVVPGAAHSIVVAQTDQAGYNTFSVTAFDDAVERATTTRTSAIYTSINTLEWGASPSVLYGAGTMNLGSNTAIATLNVDATGVSVVSATQDGALARLHYFGGLIYTDGGNVMDPVSGVFQGTCPTNMGNYQGIAAVIDPTTQTLFTLWSDGNGVTISASHLPGCALVATARIGGVVLSPYVTPRLVRFGANGLAFLSHDGKLVTLQGSFVAP